MLARLLSITVLISLMGGCSGIAREAEENQSITAGATMCQNPRPEVCTLDYRPVCGIKTDGTIASYSNSCSACAVENVSAFTQGSCEAE